ncbi:MAG: hypothetical protein L6428_06470 [Candidatus Aminicenantes bacterium]|nr:hypothetical protein [Candidatus Aminicenantes bacterium]
MKDPQKLSHRELAAFVSHHLQANGIDTVLTGGACVSLYTRNRYESYDLDFVNVAEAPLTRIRAALLRIGFAPEGRIYVNSKVKYSIDILNPPLSIGGEKITATNTIAVKKMQLKLLTPTDSVRDRLAAFYFWNDLQALEQALMVARDNEVDLAGIRRWSKKENEMEKFKFFQKKLRSNKK